MMNPITKELEWNCTSTLPSIPDFTPLATTHASIRSSSANNDDITRRLCECFAKRSLVTEELNAENARAVVRCTKDVHTTKIGVQLYQKKTAVIVEVVRLSGDMLLFRRESQAILSAAQGDDKLNQNKETKKTKKNSCMTSTKRPVLSRPAPVKKRSRSGGSQEEDQDVHMHMHMAIEKTDELIKKDRMDARIIGWASLCALTDSSSTDGSGQGSASTDTAVHASKIVLGLDDEMVTDIHMNVFDILSSSRGGCENTTTRSDCIIDEVHASQKTSIEIELALRIRRLAFQALQNALHTLYVSGNVRLLQAQDYLKHDLMMLLVEEMKCADVSPCEASMSAACLKVLFLLLQQGDDRESQSGAQEVLLQAKYTGGCSYADLAIASERALTALNNARNNDASQ